MLGKSRRRLGVPVLERRRDVDLQHAVSVIVSKQAVEHRISRLVPEGIACTPRLVLLLAGVFGIDALLAGCVGAVDGEPGWHVAPCSVPSCLAECDA